MMAIYVRISRRYIQYAHFIPIVGVGKERHTINWLVPDELQRQHPLLELPWELLALCRRTLGSERHRYAIPWPDKLGTDPMAYGG